jgi:hypothetical protein
MKRWFWRVILLALALGVVWFAWRWFFPSPQQIIRKQLDELAKAASFGPNESPATLLEKMTFLTNCISSDVVVSIELRGGTAGTYAGRDLLLAAAEGARAAIGYLRVDFVDVTVDVNPDKTSAVANLTAKGKVLGDLQVQELKFVLQKIDKRWWITRIETVKTLSFRSLPKPLFSLAHAAGFPHDPSSHSTPLSLG